MKKRFPFPPSVTVKLLTDFGLSFSLTACKYKRTKRSGHFRLKESDILKKISSSVFCYKCVPNLTAV